MCKLIIFRCFFFLFCFVGFFLQQYKYKLIRRNVFTVAVINNVSRILSQENTNCENDATMLLLKNTSATVKCTYL